MAGCGGGRPGRLHTQLRAQLTLLADWVPLPRGTAGQLSRVFDVLAGEALDRAAAGHYPGLSAINASGMPFQWSFCLGVPRSVRFLCEHGTPGQHPAQRLAGSLSALHAAADLLGQPGIGWFDDCVVRQTMPDISDWPEHWRSAMWIGVGAAPQGISIKPYLNLNRDTPLQRWRRVGWVLSALGRPKALVRLCELSPQVSPNSWPVGLAVDIRRDGNPGRVKAYFRSSEVSTAWLQRWYEAAGAAGHQAAIRALLDALPAPGTCYPARAFVVTLEFHEEDGQISLKTDLAVTKWLPADRAIMAGTSRALDLLGLDPGELTEPMELIGAGPRPGSAGLVRYVGLGYEPGGRQHLNLYLEPPTSATRAHAHSPARPAGRSPPGAVRRGIGYLIKAIGDNHWTDYRLPVGASDTWVTAYALHRLGTVRPLLSPGEQAAARRALDWLAAARAPGGGWGYNARTDDDADSTALAVLAQRRWQRQPARSSLAALARHVRDAGVGTYTSPVEPAGAWRDPVIDVTGAALQALDDHGNGTLHEAARRFLIRRQRADGLWHSYWWLTPLYATREAIRLLGDDASWAGRPRLIERLGHYQPAAPFEQALLTECLAELGAPAARHTAALARDQRHDGSWTPSAWLRVPPPQVHEPWATIDSGPCFVDERAILTTATAVAALGAIACS